jgi:hypothetical protein
MIKVILYEYDSEFKIETELPKIPEKNDIISVWIDEVWCICNIESICYEIDINNKFSHIEIAVSIN